MLTFVVTAETKNMQIAQSIEPRLCKATTDDLIIASYAHPRPAGKVIGMSIAERPLADTGTFGGLREIERRVLWLATAIVHEANRVRPNADGLKVGGHQ